MGFFGKLSSRLSSVIPCVAAAAACVASFPHPTDAAFVTGGGKLPNCDTIELKKYTCGSTGGGNCKKKRQRCIAGGNGIRAYLCEPGNGGPSDCDGNNFCKNENHDATSSMCK